MDDARYFESAKEFRDWLRHHPDERELWIEFRKDEGMAYIEAVYEALCFGWIDGQVKNVDGTLRRRFSPRRRNSNWTELNKARARYLIRTGRMTERGEKILPDLSRTFEVRDDIRDALVEAGVYEQLMREPPLYRRVRLGYVQEMTPGMDVYDVRLRNLIDKTRQGKRLGNWNDGKLGDDE